MNSNDISKEINPKEKLNDEQLDKVSGGTGLLGEDPFSPISNPAIPRDNSGGLSTIIKR